MNKTEILNPFQVFTNSRPPCYRPTLFYKERARESKPSTQRAKKLVLFKAMVGNISSTTDPSSEYNLSIRRDIGAELDEVLAFKKSVFQTFYCGKVILVNTCTVS